MFDYHSGVNPKFIKDDPLIFFSFLFYFFFQLTASHEESEAGPSESRVLNFMTVLSEEADFYPGTALKASESRSRAREADYRTTKQHSELRGQAAILVVY